MADLTWVSSAPSLRELVVFTTRDDSLRYCRGARFPAVESLTLSLETGLELDALTTVEAPALRSLHTRVAAKHEWAFVRTLALTSWFGQVETWTHRPQSVEGLLALVGCAPVRARGGRGLVALCSAPLLAEVTKEMRSQLPLSRFELLPAPEPSHDPEASRDPAEVTPAPRWAPANFRELPPRVQTTKPNPQNYDDPRATAFGSGVPYSEHYLGSRFFTRCGWCGSDDTRCIYDTSSSLYSHFETMRYYSWESECAQCGMFTHSKATTIS